MKCPVVLSYLKFDYSILCELLSLLPEKKGTSHAYDTTPDSPKFTEILEELQQFPECSQISVGIQTDQILVQVEIRKSPNRANILLPAVITDHQLKQRADHIEFLKSVLVDKDFDTSRERDSFINGVRFRLGSKVRVLQLKCFYKIVKEKTEDASG